MCAMLEIRYHATKRMAYMNPVSNWKTPNLTSRIVLVCYIYAVVTSGRKSESEGKEYS